MTSSAAAFLLCAAFAYTTGLVYHRLYLSPISRFPGPRLAASTFWYEFYYDVVLKGQYTWKIKGLHEEYGPIVRINPEELHVLDPAFYDQIYVGPARRTNKWHWSAKMFGTSMAAVGTVDHDLHRLRRNALNRFFSARSVGRLEPVIRRAISRLYARLLEVKGTGHVVNMGDAFACLSADIISDCAFGESYGLLDAEDFAPGWNRFMMELSLGTHLMKQFGWMYRLVMGMPLCKWIFELLHPLSRRLARLRQSLRQQIRKIRLEVEQDEGEGEEEGEEMVEEKETEIHRTLFHALLHGPLPHAEKSTARLEDEALTIIGAGTVTTAHTLSTTLFHILANPSILQTLQTEFHERRIFTDQPEPSWQQLSQLPYLSAVITEGLRLAHGVSHRLQRISPDADLRFGDWVIPAGTPVSMTQMLIMTSASLFPEPSAFLPQRWLPSAESHQLPPASEARRYFVPFSRGTRACVGMNLAYAELFLTIAELLRPGEAGGRFGMDIFETDGRDMECALDWFNPCLPLGSKGLRVLVT